MRYVLMQGPYTTTFVSYSIFLCVCNALVQVQRLETRVVRPLTEYGTSCRQAKVYQSHYHYTCNVCR